MAHKRPISWCQIQNSLPTVERKTKCPLPVSFSLFLWLSLCLLEICVNKMAHKKQTYGALPPIVKHFILFHSIWFRSISLAHTHISPSLSLSLAWHPVRWSKRFWVWKLKWNTAEMLQKSTNWHQLLLWPPKREKLAGKLSKKVCGKWAFPGRNKNIRKSEPKPSAFGPTLIASLASRSCSDCSSSSSRSSCCFVFYANLNITVR